MDDVITERLRESLVECEVGLIDKAELLRRADAMLAELQTPPYDPIAVSLGEDLSWSGRLDLVQHPATLRDAARLSSTLLAHLRSDKISVDELEGCAYSAAQLLSSTELAHELFQEIAEGLYVARESGGVSEADQAQARALLQRLATHAG